MPLLNDHMTRFFSADRGKKGNPDPDLFALASHAESNARGKGAILGLSAFAVIAMITLF